MATSPTDHLTSIQQAVTALNKIAETFRQYGAPFGLGDVTAINTINSTSPIKVLAADAGRLSILFHNPSAAATVLVAPSQGANSATITVSTASFGGGFAVLPQDYLQVTGSCQTAWNALVVAGSTTSTNPLTIAVL